MTKKSKPALDNKTTTTPSTNPPLDTLAWLPSTTYTQYTGTYNTHPDTSYAYGIKPPISYIKSESVEIPPREIIICDIDGVILDISHRLHYIEPPKKDYDKFYSSEELAKDAPYTAGIELVKALLGIPGGYTQKNSAIYFVTGRPQRTKKDTTDSLLGSIPGIVLNDIHCSNMLYMRKDGDYRPSPQVKSELIEQLIENMCLDLSSSLVYYIDDDPINCLRVGLDYPSIIPITFSIKRM